jgi:hypothetical protein
MNVESVDMHLIYCPHHAQAFPTLLAMAENLHRHIRVSTRVSELCHNGIVNPLGGRMEAPNGDGSQALGAVGIWVRVSSLEFEVKTTKDDC